MGEGGFDIKDPDDARLNSLNIFAQNSDRPHSDSLSSCELLFWARDFRRKEKKNYYNTFFLKIHILCQKQKNGKQIIYIFDI